jgi:mono/diheme cytochrome c family protein
MSDRLTRVTAWTAGLASLAVLGGVLVIALVARGSGGASAAAEPDLPAGRGARLYGRYCATCHGARGDGLGPSAAFLSPPPRDFRSAQFKFTGTPEGALPLDDELARIVRGGLAGTAMQAWDIPDDELAAVIAQLKAFSPAGRGFRDPARRPARGETPPDPGPGDRSEGARLYHAVMQCNACHPSYATPDELAAWGAQPRQVAPLEPVAKWSASYRSVLLPPDFLRHTVRWAREPAELYRLIAHGMQGPMPGYGHLGAAQIWPVVHYTRWLISLRGTASGDALRARLERAYGISAPAGTGSHRR